MVCGERLPAQKAGARRLVHSGECTAVQQKRRSAEGYRRRRATPDGLAKIAAAGLAANRRWRANHAEEESARRAVWRDKNREHMAAYNLEYRRSNADKVRAKNLRRRARLLGAFVEDVDLAVIWERDAGICGICLEPIDALRVWPDKQSKTLDHIVPLSRGGLHSYANSQLAHAVCNSRKNDRTV